MCKKQKEYSRQRESSGQRIKSRTGILGVGVTKLKDWRGTEGQGRRRVGILESLVVGVPDTRSLHHVQGKYHSKMTLLWCKIFEIHTQFFHSVHFHEFLEDPLVCMNFKNLSALKMKLKYFQNLFQSQVAERERQTVRVLHPLTHSPNDKNSQQWGRLKPGAPAGSLAWAAGNTTFAPSFIAFPR